MGDHIRKKRLDLKICQKEVAPIIGVSETAVFNWERGNTTPDLRTIPKIIEFLGYIPFEKEPETLGEKIVYYRRLKGITQKELARQISVDPTTLARWERGEREPHGRYLYTLMDYIK